jgi:prepilin-type N-terminal cleavage/methylation domain-containing protein
MSEWWVKPIRRAGFTLIELLAVVGIVAVLVALLLPAIQQSREAARKLQCKNNLRQLGIALHSYHERYQSFPAGVSNEWSWISKVLPSIDAENLYREIDFALEPFEPPNSDKVERVLSVLVCPTDPGGDSVYDGAGGIRFGHTNYFGTSDAGNDSGGMLGYGIANRIRDVTDGTSQTLFVGERGVDRDGATGWWSWDPLLSFEAGFFAGSPDDAESVEHFWSHHAGGGHFLLVDGAVRFLSYSISPDIFTALGTKNGADIVPGF